MSKERTFTDQMGITIQLNELPQRIVSLVPSQTELLFTLGLGNRVVGITKFCIHPDKWYRTKTRVGGPKKLKLDKIKALHPDLIIGNKEENSKDEIEALREIAPVWISDIFSLNDNHTMIREIGKMCGTLEKSEDIIHHIKVNFKTLQPLKEKITVLYLIWKDPFMAVASHTFINHILTKQIGLINAIETQDRYPILDKNQLPKADVVFLSSEPYPFKEKHLEEMQSYFPDSKLILVNGEFFTWYGSRLIEAPTYFKTLF